MIERIAESKDFFDLHTRSPLVGKVTDRNGWQLNLAYRRPKVVDVKLPQPQDTAVYFDWGRHNGSPVWAKEAIEDVRRRVGELRGEIQNLEAWLQVAEAK